jgi:hypothetical protein
VTGHGPGRPVAGAVLSAHILVAGHSDLFCAKLLQCREKHGLPRFVRNDKIFSSSLRGVFDVAIHLHIKLLQCSEKKHGLPRFSRNDGVFGTSLRGVFDAAIHLYKEF